MSKELINKLRRARESTVKIGDFTFTVRRPTDAEALILFERNPSMYDVARDHVTGWENVRGCDIASGGNDDPQPFDPALWAEWLADRSDFWAPIQQAVINGYNAHAERLKNNLKN